MNPIHFGIMISFNLCIGTITPPVGSILFTGCKVGGVSIENVYAPAPSIFFRYFTAFNSCNLCSGGFHDSAHIGRIGIKRSSLAELL